jgi:hypothetical protein
LLRCVPSVVLPIDDTRTIAYGSSGDCTIHNDSEELDSKMTEAGISLNLKKHLVGDKEMALAADIEGHCGTVRHAATLSSVWSVLILDSSSFILNLIARMASTT